MVKRLLEHLGLTEEHVQHLNNLLDNQRVIRFEDNEAWSLVKYPKVHNEGFFLMKYVRPNPRNRYDESTSKTFEVNPDKIKALREAYEHLHNRGYVEKETSKAGLGNQTFRTDFFVPNERLIEIAVLLRDLSSRASSRRSSKAAKLWVSPRFR